MKKGPAPVPTPELCQKQFLTILKDNYGESPARTFEVWAEAAYCALAKPCARPDEAEAFEARYMALVAKTKKDTVQRWPEMLGIVQQALDLTEGADFFGPLAMHDDVRAVNTHIGQFFTPFSVCQMMAKMTIHDAKSIVEAKGFITVAEPAAGSGSMLLAVAQELKAQGIDPTTQAWMDATDLSALAMHMCFIQLALVGCSGIVRQGDSLRMQFTSRTYLPLSSLFLARHGWPFAGDALSPTEPVAPVDSQPLKPQKIRQPNLFDTVPIADNEEEIAS